jgi:H+-transporting ATPase
MVALVDDSDMITGAVGTAVNDFAARGYRSLGVACGGSDGGWKCLGVLPLFDPTRDDANAAGLGDVKKKTAKALAETSIAA